jgi:hypothetical protein
MARLEHEVKVVADLLLDIAPAFDKTLHEMQITDDCPDRFKVRLTVPRKS